MPGWEVFIMRLISMRSMVVSSLLELPSLEIRLSEVSPVLAIFLTHPAERCADDT
jgi:hypothetical protein